MDSQSITAITSGLELFKYFEDGLKEDSKIRQSISDTVSDLESCVLKLNYYFDSIHVSQSVDASSLRLKIGEVQDEIKGHYSKLSEAVPAATYYKYHDKWKNITQQLVGKMCLLHYLESSDLLTKEKASVELGIYSDCKETFQLTLEDYLIGILLMVSELSRFAVNRVTAKDFNTPLKMASFIRELDSGFKMLNLKNDYLRKRYDSLKYDVKKVEEVVYDITLRGLQ